MEFATLDKMITELEKEKDVYAKSIEARIADIKECIVKMKETYRNETMPEVSGMVDYLLERAKKRLGDAIIEASDIPEDLMDDFYEVTERKVNVKRIVLGYKNVDIDGSIWFFFTDKEFYLWSNGISYSHAYSVYPYKAIVDIDYRRTGFLMKEIDIDIDRDACIINSDVYLYRALEIAKENGEAIVRLLLDLRDYANRSE